MEVKWQPVIKTKASVLFQWFVFEGHRQKYYRKSLGLNFGLNNQKIVDDEVFIDVNEFVKLEKVLIQAIQNDKKFLKTFIDKCYKNADKLLDTAKNVDQETNLIKTYKKYEMAVLGLMPFLNTILVIDGILKKEIKGVLPKENFINNLLIPKKKNFFVRETEAILEMAKKYKEVKNINKDINKYLKEFGWIKRIAYYGAFETRSGIVRRIKQLIKEGLDKKLDKSRQIKAEANKKYKKAYAKIKDSAKTVELIKLAQEFMYLQTYRLDVFFLADFQAQAFWRKVAEKFGLSVQECMYLTGEEILSGLKGQVVTEKKEIKSRQQKYSLVLKGGKMNLLSGKKVVTIKQVTQRQIIVKGVVANRGRARGKVKLVHEIADLDKVSSGDILVSVKTIPQFVTAMMRASGIITDLGGMLSHAAIVSREFGIPCVVGTKNATQVFKDGDLVELNAYEGVARKI